MGQLCKGQPSVDVRWTKLVRSQAQIQVVCLRGDRRLQSVADSRQGHLGRPFALMLRVVVGRYHAGLLAAVALAILATASVWMASNASIEAARIANDRFKFKVSQAQFAIREKLTAYQEVLRGGVGLFAATGNQVTRAAWHAYVNTLAIDKNYPGIQGI